MRTHTEYDFAHVKELQKVVSTAITASASRKERISFLLWGVVGLTASVLIITQTKWWFIGVLFGLMSLFLIARSVFYCTFLAMDVCQSMDKAVTGSDYVLEKSYMLVINPKTSNQYRYDDCFRLLETEGNIYYITKDGQGLILDKRNLKGGSVDELRAWMEDKCGKPLEWMGKARKK
jgi:hypothetical protein